MVLDCIKFIKYSIDLQNNSTFVRVVPENNKESGRLYKSHPPVSENGSGSISPIGLEFPAESQRKYPVFDFFQVAAFLRYFLFERIGRDVVQREVVAGVDYQSVVEGIGEADGNGDVGRPEQVFVFEVGGFPRSVVAAHPQFGTDEESRLDAGFQGQSFGYVKVGQDRNVQVIEPVAKLFGLGYESSSRAPFRPRRLVGGTLPGIEHVRRDGEPFQRAVFGESADDQRGFRSVQVAGILGGTSVQVGDVDSDFRAERKGFLPGNDSGGQHNCD